MTRIVFRMAIGRSPYLMAYLFSLHAMLFVSVMTVPLATIYTTMLALILAASFTLYGQRYFGLQHRRVITQLERGAEDEWYVHYGNGRRSLALTLKQSVVTSHVVMLYFDSDYFWQTFSVIVISDSVDSELFRQLRVYCRDPNTFQQ